MGALPPRCQGDSTSVSSSLMPGGDLQADGPHLLCQGDVFVYIRLPGLGAGQGELCTP